MTFIEILLIVALLVGVRIGSWYQYGRAGGTAHMRRQRDAARRACDRARGERDQLLALDDVPVAATAPVVVLRRRQRLELVQGEHA